MPKETRGPALSTTALSLRASETDLMDQYQQGEGAVSGRAASFFARLILRNVYDDAAIAARELDIVLDLSATGKRQRAGTALWRTPPSPGILSRPLVEKGYKVAICEQLEEPQKGKRIIKRDVVRVVTQAPSSKRRERTDPGCPPSGERTRWGGLSGALPPASSSWPRQRGQTCPACSASSSLKRSSPQAGEQFDTEWTRGHLHHRTAERKNLPWRRHLVTSSQSFWSRPLWEALALSKSTLTHRRCALPRYVKETQQAFLPASQGSTTRTAAKTFVFLDPATHNRNLELVRTSSKGEEGTLFSLLNSP